MDNVEKHPEALPLPPNSRDETSENQEESLQKSRFLNESRGAAFDRFEKGANIDQKPPFFDANSGGFLGSENPVFRNEAGEFSADEAEEHDQQMPEITTSNHVRRRSLEFDTRAKSSMRMRYEAEIRVLKNKIGDLEAIREKLGISKRKMCQLIMVDPSAWTRWTKSGDNAPPHIYRALQWYLALEEKYPALDVGFWLQTVAQTSQSEDQTELNAALQKEVLELRQRLSENRALAQREVSERSRELEASLEGLKAQQEALQKSLRITLSLNFILFGALVAGIVISLLR